MKLGERLGFAIGRGLGAALGDALNADEAEMPSAAKAISEAQRVLQYGTLEEKKQLIPWVLGIAEAVRPTPPPAAPEPEPAPKATETAAPAGPPPSMPPEDDDVTFPAALEDTAEIVKE